tara:strand:+ start:533 stop:2062 length:1530 start_codon:yes stop_codon:yes gene_type:complete
MPRDSEEKMRMAPEVYDFSRNFGREPNVLQKAGNLVGNIGQGLMRSVQGGARLGYQELQDERNREFELEKEKIRAGARESKAEDMLRNFTEKERIKKENKMEMNEQITELNKDLARTKGKENRETILTRQGRENNMQNVTDAPLDANFEFVGYDPSSVNTESNDFESPGEVLDQPIVNNQTGTNILGRVTKQGAELTQNPTVADSLTDRQTPKAVNLPDVDVSTDDQPFATDVSNDPTGAKGFLKNSIPNDSDLLDNPDVAPGEDDTNVPNFAPTQDAVNKGAVDKLVNMGSQLMGNEGTSSPNELAGKDQSAFEAIMAGPNYSKEERDAARNRIIQKTREKRLQSPEVQQEYSKLRGNKGLLGLDNQTLEGIALANIAQKYKDQKDQEGVSGALGDIDVVTTTQKADDFISSFAPQSILRTGEMGGKAKGIEINPSPNGDPTIGFAVDSKEGTAKYTYPAPTNILESIADTEGEDSLGRKKFNYLFRMAGRGEEGIGEGTKEVFPRII